MIAGQEPDDNITSGNAVSGDQFSTCEFFIRRHPAFFLETCNESICRILTCILRYFLLKCPRISCSGAITRAVVKNTRKVRMEKVLISRQNCHQIRMTG